MNQFKFYRRFLGGTWYCNRHRNDVHLLYWWERKITSEHYAVETYTENRFLLAVKNGVTMFKKLFR